MIHNTHMSQWIPAAAIAKTAGTWTPTLAASVASDVRTAAAAAFTLLAPIALPSNANLRNGARLKSIDVYYRIATANATDFAVVELERMTLLATQAIPTGAVVPTTINALHDTDAERSAVGTHVMTVTVTTPFWMTQADAVALAMTVTGAAGTVFTLYGVRANFDLRVD